MSNLSGVVREGWLKRAKNQKKRYFVLGFNKETGDAQLQYYENPKKFNGVENAPKRVRIPKKNPETLPKRVISLQQCLGIVKKADEKFGNVLALYSKEGIFRLIADTDELLEDWFRDLNKLHQMEYKNLQELKYDMVWKVKIVSRGLGGVKNITGSYKLCLKDNTLYFVNPVSQDIIIEEKLYYVRKFGYWENRVFMEFGRSTALGPGEIWMEVEDPLIAQKIEDSLSRSVKPKSERPERKSMVDDPRITIEQPVDNNNDSPKSRRQTFKDFVLRKNGKDGLRPHSNSMSSTPAGSAEEPLVFTGKNGSLPKKTHSGEDEDSEEKHYPKITPPAPSVPRTKSQSSGSFTEDGIIHRRKGTLDLESKHERVDCNNYANIPKTKRRSERKQDINVVRKNFIEQYKGTSSLPRRTSSSSSSDPSWRRSMGSDNFQGFNYDSDKDSTRESDKEDGEAFLQQNSDQYIKMTPRQVPIGSDSSIDEPGINNPTSFDPSSSDHGTYVPLKPPTRTPDLYVEMSRPQASAEKSRNTSARSCDSYHSPEEGGGEPEPNISAYVNMNPGLRHITSSTSSDDLPGDEQFDHLNRGESAAPSDNYVNMGPQSGNRLKKSRSQISRGKDNAYMNVDMSRSKSVGSKSPRFRIVSEQNSAPTDHDGNRVSSYVNVKAKGGCSETEANYANFVPQNCQASKEDSPGRNRRELNYASVEFPKDSPSPDRRRAKNREDNYSKIDFEKSNVLADISSTRERQLHHA